MLEKLNGKKTVIGGVLLMASMLLSQAVVGIWEYDPWWMAKAVGTLDLLGGLLVGGGIIHKGVKSRAAQ